MTNGDMVTIDANEAVASVAHRTNEVIVLYPITPSSPMGEWCDEWSAQGRRNLWNAVPDVTRCNRRLERSAQFTARCRQAVW